MPQKRTMPSKKRVIEHWANRMESLKCDEGNDIFEELDGVCFACGLNWPVLERAHIISKIYGGSDEVENIHLLCRTCHFFSENLSGDKYQLWINSWSSIKMLKVLTEIYGVVYHKEFAA